MTDADAVLHRIDNALGNCVCGEPLTLDGGSLDYCSEDCQEEWQERAYTPQPEAEADTHTCILGTRCSVHGLPPSQQQLIGEGLRYLLRLDQLEVTVPDAAERAAYMEAARLDIDRAIALAQWGIPADLAAANPYAPIEELARRVHIQGTTTVSSRVRFRATGRGHDWTAVDDGEKTTLTCSCEQFTAICEGGTEAERAATVELGFNDHLDHIEGDHQ